MGQGNLANNSANFELVNPILVGEPNFILVRTNEYFANRNETWRSSFWTSRITEFLSCEIFKWPIKNQSHNTYKVKMIMFDWYVMTFYDFYGTKQILDYLFNLTLISMIKKCIFFEKWLSCHLNLNFKKYPLVVILA